MAISTLCYQENFSLHILWAINPMIFSPLLHKDVDPPLPGTRPYNNTLQQAIMF
jgi:hypothetical protein